MRHNHQNCGQCLKKWRFGLLLTKSIINWNASYFLELKIDFRQGEFVFKCLISLQIKFQKSYKLSRKLEFIWPGANLVAHWISALLILACCNHAICLYHLYLVSAFYKNVLFQGKENFISTFENASELVLLKLVSHK